MLLRPVGRRLRRDPPRPQAHRAVAASIVARPGEAFGPGPRAADEQGTSSARPRRGAGVHPVRHQHPVGRIGSHRAVRRGPSRREGRRGRHVGGEDHRREVDAPRRECRPGPAAKGGGRQQLGDWPGPTTCHGPKPTRPRAATERPAPCGRTRRDRRGTRIPERGPRLPPRAHPVGAQDRRPERVARDRTPWRSRRRPTRRAPRHERPPSPSRAACRRHRSSPPAFPLRAVPAARAGPREARAGNPALMRPLDRPSGPHRPCRVRLRVLGPRSQGGPPRRRIGEIGPRRTERTRTTSGRAHRRRAPCEPSPMTAPETSGATLIPTLGSSTPATRWCA